ncbi:MAG TPA: DUF998 domain-containing protein [Ktedonobacteraceae bacterium]|nr:DUF998 domain-containing protein [Ktedonobacteraceae bacterium]
MQTTTKSASLITTQGLALLSLAGVVLYIAIDVLLFFLRPDLSIVYRAESDYGNGPWAWIMDINFLLRCALSLAAIFAFWYALPRTLLSQLAPGLLTLWAIASGILAFFPDDYEGTPPTTHGKIHLLAAALAFLCCLLATLLLTVVLVRLWRGQPIVAALIISWLIAAVSLLLLLKAGFTPGQVRRTLRAPLFRL